MILKLTGSGQSKPTSSHNSERMANHLLHPYVQSLSKIHHILDNKCFNESKRAFEKYNIEYQPVLPAMHRVIAAEHAAQAFKITSLQYFRWPRGKDCSHISSWLWIFSDHRIHSSFSSHASLVGNHDYNWKYLASWVEKLFLWQQRISMHHSPLMSK